jgi:hypothetical protein
MAVPDAQFLFAVGRAHARIYVKRDASRRTAAVHKIDPLPRLVGKSREVLGAASHCVSKRPSADACGRVVAAPLTVYLKRPSSLRQHSAKHG